MTLENLIYCLIAGILVLLNGFFVLVEFALVKVRRSKLEELIRAGSKRAALAHELHRKMDAYLSATQLGITIASLGLGWVGEPAFAKLFEPFLKTIGIWSPQMIHTVSFIIAFVIITFLHILIGELAPKSIAIRKPEQSILITSLPMKFFYIVFYVPLHILNSASNSIIRLFGISGLTETESAVSEEELRIILAHSQKSGEITLNRLLLFENALDLKEIAAEDVMTPLHKTVMIDLQKPWQENLALIQKHRFTRYPLCEGVLPNGQPKITGIVHIKEFGIALMAGNADTRVEQFKREILTIQESMPIETLLREFQRRRKHMALVIDKNNNPKGIITMEDIIEEMVGEIVDEFEREQFWNLADYIPKEAVLLDITANDFESAIRDMVKSLGAGIGPAIEKEKIVRMVIDRERESSTFLGRGIVVPHARIDGLPQPCVAFGRVRKCLMHDECSEINISLIFLILTPKSMPIAQVMLLSRIAGLAQSEYTLNALRDAKTPEKVIEMIKTADVSATSES